MRRLISFILALLMSAALVSARQEFIELPGNPVITPGFAGGFDAGAVRDPEIVWDGDRVRLYYTAEDRDGRSRIGLAVSADLVHWISEGIVLEAGPAGAFDGDGVFGPSVMLGNGRTVMFYTGESSGFTSIGRIESVDGVRFDRVNAPPVVVLSPSYNGDAFDGIGVARASVMKTGGVYVMMYEGDDGGIWPRLGLAGSFDGLDFFRVPGDAEAGANFGRGPHGFSDGGAYDPEIWEKDGDIRMLYTSLHY